MDENSAQPQVIYTASTPLFKKKLFQAGVLLAISPLFVLAFLWLKEQPLFQPKLTLPVASSSATLKSIKESELPIALDILQNPMVYEWRGSVEGILVSKDEKSIVLEKDDQRITISVDLNPNYTGTKFFKGTPAKDPKANFISLDDIPVGTKLRGDFFIFAHRKNELVGSSFEVLD